MLTLAEQYAREGTHRHRCRCTGRGDSAASPRRDAGVRTAGTARPSKLHRVQPAPRRRKNDTPALAKVGSALSTALVKAVVEGGVGISGVPFENPTLKDLGDQKSTIRHMTDRTTSEGGASPGLTEALKDGTVARSS